MLRRLLDVRPEERRPTAIAFLVLFGILAAHTILETARDALFLARLPPSQLPWMYLAIAAIAVGLSHWTTRRLSGSRALATLLTVCAAGTLPFWAIGSSLGPWGLRALYVWTGLVSTLAAVQFWLVVGEIYTITQAKRVYAVIGLGSLLGAVAGGGLARIVSTRVDAHHLLLLSAAVLGVTAFGPAILLLRPGAVRARAPTTIEPAFAEGLRLIRRHPYLARLAGLVLISTLAITLADYVFKSAVARAVPPEHLASFFASFYTVLNGLALAAQLFLVSWLMRVLGVNRALWVLPAFLLLGAAGVAIGGGLIAAQLLKGADGVLRPSLHRMGMELLFVPIPDQVRPFAKLTDALGQRGGQALASIFILGWLAQGRGDTMLAFVSALLCIVWIAWTMNVNPHYLEVFRVALRNGTLRDTVHLPALDMGALEVLFAALNSQDDAEVLGALDLLDEEGRARLVPALILYHPSRAVVFRALNILAKSGRVDFVPIADRLFDSSDAEIRAAALRARSTVRPEASVLGRAAEDSSPLVRATGIVGLVAGGWRSDDARQKMDDLLKSSSVDTQVAFVRAIERQPAPGFEDVVLRLAACPDSRVLRHVAHAMGKIKSPSFLPKLLLMLGRREVRNETRVALLQHGDNALRMLDVALGDRNVPQHIRRHIPHTISQFAPDQATPVLQKHLLEEPDGLVRFKILRALGRIAADHPLAAFDEVVLREATERTIDAAIELLYWRINLIRGAAAQPNRSTPGHSLIVMLLRDKERHTVERIFRLLGLAFRHEDLRSIHRGLANSNPKVRAGSRELLDNLLASPLRESVLGLVDDVADERRLAGLRPDAARDSIEYEALLTVLGNGRRPTLRSLAGYHARELGLTMHVRRAAPRVEGRRRFCLTRARSRAGAGRPGDNVMNEEMDVNPALSIFEKILHLRRGPTGGASNAVSAGELSVFADEMRDRSFKAGTVLLREGEAPVAAYSLVRGRVRVSRRGHVLGEVGPGAAVGIGAIFSRDALGLGAVATTDVLALELDRDTLVDIFEDVFPFLLEAIRESSRRHLDFIRNMKQVPEQVPAIHPEPFLSGRLDFVQRLLFLKTPGGPFERSSVDALAEIAQRARYRSIEPGTTLWSEGERSGGASGRERHDRVLIVPTRRSGPVPRRARQCHRRARVDRGAAPLARRGRRRRCRGTGTRRRRSHRRLRGQRRDGNGFSRVGIQ